MPLENHPNIEYEKPKNSLSMIDRFAENGLQHISRLSIRDIISAVEKRFAHTTVSQTCQVLSTLITS